MGLLDFWAKRSQPWEIVFQETSARPVAKTKPSDRTSTMGWLIYGWGKNFLIREVLFCGKPINRSQFEDLAADAHLMVMLAQSFESEGISIEEAFARGLPEPNPAILQHAAYRLARALQVDQSVAFEIMARRTSRGFATITKQQIP